MYYRAVIGNHVGIQSPYTGNMAAPYLSSLVSVLYAHNDYNNSHRRLQTWMFTRAEIPLNQESKITMHAKNEPLLGLSIPRQLPWSVATYDNDMQQ